jgi:hypothetical protein
MNEPKKYAGYYLDKYKGICRGLLGGKKVSGLHLNFTATSLLFHRIISLRQMCRQIL